MAEVDTAAAEIAAPEVAAQIRDLNRLVAAHESVGNSILTALREGSPDGRLATDPDAIAEMASRVKA